MPQMVAGGYRQRLRRVIARQQAQLAPWSNRNARLYSGAAVDFLVVIHPQQIGRVGCSDSALDAQRVAQRLFIAEIQQSPVPVQATILLKIQEVAFGSARHIATQCRHQPALNPPAERSPVALANAVLIQRELVQPLYGKGLQKVPVLLGILGALLCSSALRIQIVQ